VLFDKIASVCFIVFEKYTYILALEMASPGNQHCANCIGTLSFPITHRLSQIAGYATRRGVDRRRATSTDRALAWVAESTAAAAACAIYQFFICNQSVDGRSCSISGAQSLCAPPTRRRADFPPPTN